MCVCRYVLVPYAARDCYLVHLLREIVENPRASVIVFVSTRDACELVGTHVCVCMCVYVCVCDSSIHTRTHSRTRSIHTPMSLSLTHTHTHIGEMLDALEVPNVALHANLNQARRLASLGKFRSELVRVLIATDVASRGLDIPTVTSVINFGKCVV
jgi:superfamily II DNA/RNA helicase